MREKPADPVWEWSEIRDRCLAQARRHSNSAEAAEDIAQEALIRAWRYRERLQAQEKLGAWLASIVSNEAARYYARRRPELIGVSEAEVAGGEDELILHAAERVDLATAIATLPPREAMLLRLRYAEDLTQGSIARLLEMPEGTVKVALHRARNHLRRALRAP